MACRRIDTGPPTDSPPTGGQYRSRTKEGLGLGLGLGPAVSRSGGGVQSWATEMTLLAALVPSLPLKVAVGGEPTGLML